MTDLKRKWLELKQIEYFLILYLKVKSFKIENIHDSIKTKIDRNERNSIRKLFHVYHVYLLTFQCTSLEVL